MAMRRGAKNTPVYVNDRSSNVLTQLDQIPEFQLKKKLEALRRKINTVLDELAHDVDKAIEEPHGFTRTYLYDTGSRSERKKVFFPRESVLSRLLSDVDFQTIYNMALAILVMFFLGVVIRDHYEKHVVLDMDLVWWSFGRFHLVLAIWSFLFLLSFSIIPISEKGRKNQIPFEALIGIVSALYLLFLAIPAFFIIYLQLPTASSMTLMSEATRLLLKMHSYFRERISNSKWPSRTGYKSKKEILAQRAAAQAQDTKSQETESDIDTSTTSTTDGLKQRKNAPQSPKSPAAEAYNDEDLKSSEASRFAYFLFAPTLIYREVYPRTPRIRWEFVVRTAAECAGCILYITVVFQKYVQGVSWGVNTDAFYDWRNVVISIFNSMVPGTLIMVLGFFTLLHCWMNLMAELTQFADREFYEDWWNAPGFHTYYRKWNLIIHEWLYYYIYQELKAVGLSSLVSKICVFAFSATFLEIIVTFTTRFFLPLIEIHFLVFGPILIFASNLLANANPRAGNLFMWLSFFLQNGILMVIYSREWYARMALPEPLTGWRSLVPLSLIKLS